MGSPRISEAEWVVMRVIWRRHPATAAEVIRVLEDAGSDWHPKTVRTLLGRLVEKGALSYRRRGRAYEYAPRVSESACVSAASESFLERVFGGSMEPMLAHFVRHRKLSAEEIAELKRLLNEAEGAS